MPLTVTINDIQELSETMGWLSGLVTRTNPWFLKFHHPEAKLYLRCNPGNFKVHHNTYIFNTFWVVSSNLEYPSDGWVFMPDDSNEEIFKQMEDRTRMFRDRLNDFEKALIMFREKPNLKLKDCKYLADLRVDLFNSYCARRSLRAYIKNKYLCFKSTEPAPGINSTIYISYDGTTRFIVTTQPMSDLNPSGVRCYGSGCARSMRFKALPSVGNVVIDEHECLNSVEMRAYEFMDRVRELGKDAENLAP